MTQVGSDSEGDKHRDPQYLDTLDIWALDLDGGLQVRAESGVPLYSAEVGVSEVDVRNAVLGHIAARRLTALWLERWVRSWDREGHPLPMTLENREHG